MLTHPPSTIRPQPEQLWGPSPKTHRTRGILFSRQDQVALVVGDIAKVATLGGR